MERREFIKTAAAVAASAAVPPQLAARTGKTAGHAVPAQEDSAGNTSAGLCPVSAPAVVHPGATFKLTWFPYELKLAHTFTVATCSRDVTPGVQVRLEFDGVTGYGEAAMPQYLGQSVESVVSFLSKVNLSGFHDPFLLEDILGYIDSLSPGDTAAKAAVDIALHDLVGKLLGAPWYRIWGLDPSKAPDTTYTIGIDTPEMMREKTLECAGRFNILKVKVGTPDDRRLVRAVREETNLPLTADANQGWKDKEQALDEIFWLNENGVVMIEQPMPKDRADDNAWITERSPIPVFADEAVQRLSDIPAAKGVYSGINIKLMKCGGMREAWRMLNMARGLGMRVMLGCMTETSCAVTAAAQLSPAADFADLDGNLLITNDLFSGVEVVNGHLLLPDRPGLGLLDRRSACGKTQ